MVVPRWIIESADHFKSKEMWNETVRINPLSLPYVANRFKNQETFDAAKREGSSKLEFVLDHLKTQRMCNEVAANNTYMLRYIPECFKSQ